LDYIEDTQISFGKLLKWRKLTPILEKDIRGVMD